MQAKISQSMYPDLIRWTFYMDIKI